jgi:hypothetical protein
MTGDRKFGPASPVADNRGPRPKSSNYDIFEGLQQTRLRATEANRKRLIVGTFPATAPDVKE